MISDNNYYDYNDYRDSDLDLDLDWEQFSELLAWWHKLQNMNHDIEE